jgi:membrane-associated protease RseP (regulator of RpoE activity)
MMNLFLAAFDMVPALPMDGGRLLRTLLSIWFGYARAAEIAGTIGPCGGSPGIALQSAAHFDLQYSSVRELTP